MPASARLSFLAVRWHTQRDSRSLAVYLQVVVSGLLQRVRPVGLPVCDIVIAGCVGQEIAVPLPAASVKIADSSRGVLHVKNLKAHRRTRSPGRLGIRRLRVPGSSDRSRTSSARPHPSSKPILCGDPAPLRLTVRILTDRQPRGRVRRIQHGVRRHTYRSGCRCSRRIAAGAAAQCARPCAPCRA